MGAKLVQAWVAAGVAISSVGWWAASAGAAGSDDDDGGDDDFSVVEALEELPTDALGDGWIISVADLDAAATVSGLDARPTDRIELVSWLLSISGGAGDPVPPVYALLPEELVQVAASDEGDDPAAGFGIQDVARYALVHAPPQRFAVVWGDFDEHTLSDELVDLGDGVRSLGEGEDLAQNLQEIHQLDRLGRPVRLAERDGRIALGLSTEQVAAWLADEGDRVVEDDQATDPAASGADLRAVAETLDDADVVSAILTEPPNADLLTALGPGASPEALEQLGRQLEGIAIDRPVFGLGLGWTSSTGVARPVIVYQFATDADAAASAERVRAVFEEGESVRDRRPLSDLFVVEEIVVEGRHVTAFLAQGPSGRPGTLVNMLFSLDLPYIVVA